MEKTTAKRDAGRMISESRAALDEIVRPGARRMLQEALEHEVAEYLALMAGKKDGDGRQEVVRNGFLPERELITGVGPLSIRKPRVRDREGKTRFSSWILPPFMRRVPSVDALIPVLYLKGISTGDFSEALEAILGPQAAGLSATNIVRLKEGWREEYETWAKRDLSDRRYVYWWADGIYFNVRLDTERPCLLILMGALEDGTKELAAVWDETPGKQRLVAGSLTGSESPGSGRISKAGGGRRSAGLLGGLGGRAVENRGGRCWVHKTSNVLDKMPRSVQPYAKKMIHEMYLSPTKEKALAAYRRFLAEYEAKYPKATDCLRKDEDVLFTFYDFPAEHWMHIRTTNPIESAFATVRHRTRQTKGCGSRQATLMMVFKLAKQAERHWRKLNGAQLLAHVIRGVVFTDGVMEKAA